MKSIIKKLLREGLDNRSVNLETAAELLLNYYNNMGYSSDERLTSSEKKSRMAKMNRSKKKLDNYLGFDIGYKPSHTPEQTDFIQKMYDRVDGLRKQLRENIETIKDIPTPILSYEEFINKKQIPYVNKKSIKAYGTRLPQIKYFKGFFNFSDSEYDIKKGQEYMKYEADSEGYYTKIKIYRTPMEMYKSYLNIINK